MRKGVIIAAAILLGALLIYAGLYYYSIGRVEATDIEINDVQFSQEGTTVLGQIKVYNAGILPVTIQTLDYTVEVGEHRLAESTAKGTKISPGEYKMFPFDAKLDWAPTTETLLDLASKDHVYVRLTGKMKVGEYITTTHSFSKEFDIKKYLLSIVEKFGVEKETASKALEVIGKGVEIVKGILS